jgi:tyrosinase
MSSEPQTSDVPRHQRFRNVMDAAAGSANPQYDGYGRFWNLPLSDLRDVTIYSIPMMRGAVPGLVTGLRGLYPFDGSQYPRLPWGRFAGRRVRRPLHRSVDRRRLPR